MTTLAQHIGPPGQPLAVAGSPAHSPLSPSGASARVFCPGKIYLCKGYPDVGGEAAAEGTASHWVGSQLLLGLPTPTPGSICPENGVVLSEEMIDGAKFYAGQVQAVTKDRGINMVEQRVTVPPVHPQCFGTIDHYSYIADEDTLYVDDYKFGWTPVDPVGNWQLIIYAVGVLVKMQLLGDPSRKLCLRIIQPRPHHRLGPVREWRVTAGELMPYVQQLQAAAAEAMTPTARVCSGSHCKYCRARHACPALSAASMQAIDYICQGQPDELTVEAMAREYRTLDHIEQLIKARKSGHEARMIGMIENGQPVPGYTVEPGFGHATWNKQASEIIGLGELLGVSLAAPATAITPAQARTRGLSEQLIAQYSGRKVTSKKLVETTNSRSALAFGASPAQGV